MQEPNPTMKPAEILTRIGLVLLGLEVLIGTLGALGMRILLAAFRQSLRGLVVTAVLAGVLLASAGSAKRVGDNLQIALPLLAWGCAAANGEGPEFATRYAVMFAGAHAVKQLAGDASWNIRPSGRGEGFPSAHSATAALGATSLALECLRQSPVAQGVVLIATGATGASRIEAGAHTFWQVLFGWLWGILCATAARPLTPARRWLARLLTRLHEGGGAALQSAAAAIARIGKPAARQVSADRR